ncbi:MAG: OadG family protein [Cyclobacteriaceae bacterium]|nr:OadG family protein [Cyclobacteriaceae bacterium SS2]
MEINTALNLLFIGMITVFVVLLLVYGTGNLLIRIVNLMPDQDEEIKKEGGISNKKIAVLNAAVEAFTAGKGTITQIEKLK